MIKNVKIIILLFVVAPMLHGNEMSENLINKYNILYEDLKNYNTIAYKASSVSNDIEGKAFHVQGSLFHVPNDNEGRYIFPITLAISGKGFFRFQNNNEVIYSRKGLLYLSDSFNLVSEEGYTLLPKCDLAYDPSKVSSMKISIKNNILFFKFEYFDGTILDYEYKIRLYNPEVESIITKRVEYYSFKNVEESNSFSIYNNVLELSTTDILAVTSEMLVLLDTINRRNQIINYNRKVYFLEKIQEHFISLPRDKIFVSGQYDYNSPIIDAFIKHLQLTTDANNSVQYEQ